MKNYIFDYFPAASIDIKDLIMFLIVFFTHHPTPVIILATILFRNAR